MIQRTPPMGWNSWNTFGENISEELIFQTADAMVETGLRDAGYDYLVIDDCWAEKTRDADGPSGSQPGEIPARDEGGQRLCTQQGPEIRDVFLHGHSDLRRVSGQL